MKEADICAYVHPAIYGGTSNRLGIDSRYEEI